MKSLLSIFISCVTCVSLQSALFACDIFERWETVNKKDWQVAEDSSRGIHHAVMIFEKIEANDRNLLREKCYYTVYRRIRILSPQGREWGDVEVPYLDKKQKIEMLGGRTTLPNGREFYITEDQIYEKEVLKTKGVRVKQKSFSLPGITDDCIIEYYYKIRTPNPTSNWLVQKSIFLKYGKFNWKFYRGKGFTNWVYNQIADKITPNYMWFNTDKPLDLNHRPSLKDPQEVDFVATDVMPFKVEAYTMPDLALKTQVRFTYGLAGSPDAYWGIYSQTMTRFLAEFTGENKRLKKVLEDFAGLSEDEKVKAAYKWLQNNIVNTSYDKLKHDKYKKANVVDDVIKHGYGDNEEINIAFYDMLREMNIDASIVLTVDRDDNFFVRRLKSPQFDRSVVMVPTGTGSYRYYSPGEKYLLPGQIPWYNQGTSGLVVGDLIKLFHELPLDGSRKNRIQRCQYLTFNYQLNLVGELLERRAGSPGRDMRLDIAGLRDEEIANYLHEAYTAFFPGSELDSLQVSGVETPQASLSVGAAIQWQNPGQQIGDRFLIKPFDFFSRRENPFQAETREHPIVFDYGYEYLESLHIDLPEDWRVEALPSDTTFANVIGGCQVTFKEVGQKILIQRLFQLKRPILNAKHYPSVRALFQAQQALAEMVVVLRKNVTAAK